MTNLVRPLYLIRPDTLRTEDARRSEYLIPVWNTWVTHRDAPALLTLCHDIYVKAVDIYAVSQRAVGYSLLARLYNRRWASLSRRLGSEGVPFSSLLNALLCSRSFPLHGAMSVRGTSYLIPDAVLGTINALLVMGGSPPQWERVVDGRDAGPVLTEKGTVIAYSPWSDEKWHSAQMFDIPRNSAQFPDIPPSISE